MKNKGVLSRLFGYLKPYGVSLIFVMIFAVVSTVFTVLAPTVTGEITTALYDGVASGAFDWQKIAMLLVGLVLLYLIAQLFAFLQNFGMSKITAKVMQGLRNDIDRKMHRTKLNYYDTRTNGEILSVITNDVDTVNIAVIRVIFVNFNALQSPAGIESLGVDINNICADIYNLYFFVTVECIRTDRNYFLCFILNHGKIRIHIGIFAVILNMRYIVDIKHCHIACIAVF